MKTGLVKVSGGLALVIGIFSCGGFLYLAASIFWEYPQSSVTAQAISAGFLGVLGVCALVIALGYWSLSRQSISKSNTISPVSELSTIKPGKADSGVVTFNSTKPVAKDQETIQPFVSSHDGPETKETSTNSETNPSS